VKTSLLTLCLISIFISSCGTSPTILQSSTSAPTKIKESTPSATFTPIPTETILPTLSPTSFPTITPHAINEPGFIISLEKQERTISSSLVFSPDGSILAQANSSVKLWDISNHKLIRELKYPYSEKYYATKALFSPDGSFLVVSITDYLMHLEKPNSHLLVWDVATGELQQEWVQEYAVMSAYDGFGGEPRVYTIPVDAMAFFPASTKLAYANGNRIEIKDVQKGGESTGWSLGDTMYASDLSIRDDSKFLYVLMRWYKDLTFPALYRYKFTAQIWHPATKGLRREIKLEEVYPGKEDVWLVGEYLLHQDTVKPAFEALDLSTDEKRDFPYRIGVKYFNEDASLMLVTRLTRVDEDKESLELWNTDTWRNIYTFKPDFIDEWYFLGNIVFSPDNSLLAIEYDGQVSLWDIRSVQP
jgi:WD40 repeat protein